MVMTARVDDIKMTMWGWMVTVMVRCFFVGVFFSSVHDLPGSREGRLLLCLPLLRDVGDECLGASSAPLLSISGYRLGADGEARV